MPLRSPAQRGSRLLDLNCTPRFGLGMYRRSLGPPERVPVRTDPVIGEQLRTRMDEERERMLRNPIGAGAQPLDSLVGPRIEVEWVAANPNKQGPPVYPPAPVVSVTPQQPPLPPEHFSRAYSPVAGDLATYPPALREALVRASATIALEGPLRQTRVFRVVHSHHGNYAGDWTTEVARCASGAEANQKVAGYFVDEFWNDSMLEEPEFHVSAAGTLRCEVSTDGSMGGLEIIWVKEDGV
ncbi:hypothetical protein FB567DRAFT_596541 [Paraphoma chrysanthemicola]|uniref:Uncharacterized protein n=1 Tax=Paraphoma chrysanthemicola TaxID=798071 RepID=A0A8K0QX20_9PLEO|nr:hypothetical protein FB567DRAFT_596541 [Paraphoma chrysanthemicola]